MTEQVVSIGNLHLAGELVIPGGAAGVVLFAHGSGSSRQSPRNHFVAEQLQQAGFGTLLMDLLTEEEERIDAQSRQLRFDIRLLTKRLLEATDWLAEQPETQDLAVGYFGASTGAAAALAAAAEKSSLIHAVVSRGGRPDLAWRALSQVRAPVLLVVGGADRQVLDLNRQAVGALRCEKQLSIVPAATHLFEEPGALEEVAELAAAWFGRHLVRPEAACGGV
jgi:dienelactone hydrolase